MDVYWWLSAWTEYVYCSACWIILPHPWGKLIKTQLFGKQDFKGFCENCVFLILPRICSQKIEDSQSRLINSSIFMVSPPRSQEKRWLTLPHFPLYLNICICKNLGRGSVWSVSSPCSTCLRCLAVGATMLELVKEKPIIGRHWGRFLVSPKVNAKVSRA